LIQEYLAGGELFKHIIDRDHLSEKEAADIFSQMIRALIYCHKKNITHRDVKPENFLFKSKKEGSLLKIIDFGYARKFEKTNADETKKMLHRMRSKVGTENYIAPEIIQKNYSNSCDVWSAGVILYIMLSGCPPFEGDDEAETMKLIETLEYDFDDESFEEVSAEAKDLIKNILTYEDQRMTLDDILEHDWITKNSKSSEYSCMNVNLVDKLKNFTRATKLRKAVATLIATQISDNDILESMKAFQNIDKNNDGELSIEELERGMGTSTLQQRKTIMDHVDTDKNDRINYIEFIAATLNENSLKNVFTINTAFKFFDRDGNGKIEKEELKQILQGSSLDRLETNLIKDILLECDLNDDGYIDKDEFYR